MAPDVWLSHRTGAIAAALVLLAATEAVDAQVFVYPRRPGKSHVRYFEFDWRHVDIKIDVPPGPPVATTPESILWSPDAGVEIGSNVTPSGVAAIDHGGSGNPDGGSTGSERPASSGASNASGGTAAGTPPPLVNAPADASGPVATTSNEHKSGMVRLYFYERERLSAEHATWYIEDSYRYLADQFHFVPPKSFPYILYNSYQEFLQTNLFPLQEGVLGVTSPTTLTLTLPYFGDHRLFQRIGTHEMAHQFTIQKVHSIVGESVFGDPLETMPLWFVEGLAEFYALRGLDDESEMLVRDLVINPDPEHGYVLPGFFDEQAGGFLGVYKLGQAKCTFLEETYGSGAIQRILDRSTLLAGNRIPFSAIVVRPRNFRDVLKYITGDDEQGISNKFEAWLKRRAFQKYLEAKQDIPELKLLPEVSDIIQALATSPDGTLLLYRAIDTETGRSRLVLMDYRNPNLRVTVVSDGGPGVESLHPVAARNFDLTDNALVFVAQSNGFDVLYYQPIEHQARWQSEGPNPYYRPPASGYGPYGRPPIYAPGAPYSPTGASRRPERWEIKLSLGSRTAFPLEKAELLAAESPAFSPDGRQVAFVGLDSRGVRDLFVMPLSKGGDVKVRRLTNDIYAERQVSWGQNGLVYTSDATQHGRMNLFRMRPEDPNLIEQLTNKPRDQQDPRVMPDGRILFTAYDHGRADLYEVTAGGVVQRTEISTGLYDSGPAPEGGIWTLLHHSGRRRIARLSPPVLLSEPQEPQPPSGPPVALPSRPLANAQSYNLFDLHNWERPSAFGFIAGGSSGIIGQVIATDTDKFSDRAVILNVLFYGQLSWIDGYLQYVDQSGRALWGGGPFHSLRFRLDHTFDQLLFTSLERFYGMLGSMRYPLNRFFYLQTDLAIGGTSYFLTPDSTDFLSFPELNFIGDLLPEWNRINGGTRFQSELVARLGYDTVRYYRTGHPIAGDSLLLEGVADVQPFNGLAFGNARLDAEHFFPLFGGARIVTRASLGTTIGGRYARQFYLSSFDTLRGVNFGDSNWLLGRKFYFATTELALPLSTLIRIFFLSDLEGIAGVDFGGVADRFTDDTGRLALFDKRVLDLALGFNLGLGPFVFRLHFAKPFNINSPLGVPDPGWVTNFSIRLIGLEGFLGMGSKGTDAHSPPNLDPGVRQLR